MWVVFLWHPAYLLYFLAAKDFSKEPSKGSDCTRVSMDSVSAQCLKSNGTGASIVAFKSASNKAWCLKVPCRLVCFSLQNDFRFSVVRFRYVHYHNVFYFIELNFVVECRFNILHIVKGSKFIT